MDTIRVWLSSKPYPEDDMDRPPDTVIRIDAADLEPKTPLTLTDAWLYDAGGTLDDETD